MSRSTARRDLARLMPAFAFALVLAGCGASNSPTAPSARTSDQAAVNAVLASDPSFLDDGLMNAGTSTQAARLQPAGPAASIPPLTFWRAITGSSLDVAYAFSDSDAAGRPHQADVTVTRRFTGTFNVLTASGDTGSVVHKPLADTWVRYLRLRRLPTGGGDATVWRLTDGSLVEVTSDAATTTVASVRVQGPGVDTTITDPTALWSLPRVRAFSPGDIVTVTATTGRADDVVLGYWHDRRAPFQNNGDGTYTFDLHIGDTDGGWRWFAVNAVSNGTLHDDTLPYDSKAWVFGCFVGPRPDRDWY